MAPVPETTKKRPRRKSQSVLERQCALWNQEHAVGTAVDVRCAAGQQPYLPPVPPGMGCVAAQLGWWSTVTVTNFTPGIPPTLSSPGQPATFTLVETITLPRGVPIQYRDPLPLMCWLSAHGGPPSLVSWSMMGSVWRNSSYTAAVQYGPVFTITVN